MEMNAWCIKGAINWGSGVGVGGGDSEGDDGGDNGLIVVVVVMVAMMLVLVPQRKINLICKLHNCTNP